MENIENKVKKIVNSLAFKILLILVLSGGLTIVALYYSVGNLGRSVFFTYFHNFWILFLNFLPILLCMLLVYSLSRKFSIAFLITTAIFYTGTLVNFFKFNIRNDTLVMEDIFLIKEAMQIKTNYTFNFSILMIILIIFFIALSILIYFLVDRNQEKKEITLPKKILIRTIPAIAIAFISVILLNKVYINPKFYEKTSNIGDFNIWNSSNQYATRGWIFSFLNTYSSLKKNVPEGYNKNDAERLLYQYEYSDIEEDKKVNIIGIMLEAYNDFSKFAEIEFNIDPYEKFHQLEKESYHGELVTSIFAGGTIDTERKFLTGYTSLPSMRKRTNSYVDYFKEQGYTVEGSHPCYEWFYNRVNINRNLGFQNYYFIENKYGGIVRDSILMPEILNLYNTHKETSDNPYFSFNVTYQNHGPYDSSKNYSGLEYIKRKEGYTEESLNIINNYLQGINDTNENVYNLVQELKKDDEPVILILFGDHNPWLGNDNSVYKMIGMNLNLDTEEGCFNYYDTFYLIWANDKAKEILENDFIGEGEKISPNFLMNKVFELCNYGGNEYTKATNELMKSVNVLNTFFYIENGKFTRELNSEDKEKLNTFYKLQYYYANEYREK